MAEGLKGYLTPKEAAAKTGKCIHAVRYWIQVGHLAVTRFGKLALISEKDLAVVIKKIERGEIARGRPRKVK